MNPLDRDEKVVPVGDINEKIDEILEAMRRTWHPTKEEMIIDIKNEDIDNSLPFEWIKKIWELETGRKYA